MPYPRFPFTSAIRITTRFPNDAVRRYYQDRYHIDEYDLKAVRALVAATRSACSTR